MKMPQVQTTHFVPAGGLDEITPPLQMKDGVCRLMQNFEQGIRGGYRRIDGFERYAGQRPSTDLVIEQVRLRGDAVNGGNLWGGVVIEGATSGARALVLGATGTSWGASGIAAPGYFINPNEELWFNVADLIGTFEVGESIQLVVIEDGTEVVVRQPTTIVVAEAARALPGATPQQYALAKSQAIEQYRQAITAVWPYDNPGKILGIGSLDGVVYAFVHIRSIGSVGGQNGVFDFINVMRVRLETSELDPPNVNTLGLAYTWTTISLIVVGEFNDIFPVLPDRVDLVEYNFYGATRQNRLYGVSGVGKAFSFDGNAITPITTGMTVDKPNRIAVHKNRLFLGFGASLQFSTAGNPTQWSAVVGTAGEISMGENITHIQTIIGSDQSSALMVATERSVAILYGDTSTDFKLVWVNRQMGVKPYSFQTMQDPVFVNDYGVTTLGASQSFGNFQMATITELVQKFVQSRLQKVTASCLVRSKNQYRVFFSDGTGLYITFSGSKVSAITPVRFDRVVRQIWSTFDKEGKELILFSSDDMYIYRMDVGATFDGNAIEAFFFTSFSHKKSPQLRKSFKRVVLEVEAEGAAFFKAGVDVDASSNYAKASEERDIVSGSAYQWDSDARFDEFTWDSSERTPVSMSVTGTGKNISLFVRCNEVTVEPFTITGVSTHWIGRRLER